MQSRRGWPLVFCVTVLSVFSSLTEAQDSGFRVDAKAAVLLDVASEQILYDQDATLRIPPASLTKLMTVLLAYDALREGTVHLDDTINVSQHASKMGGSQIFLERGDRVTFRALLEGVAIASGNDATIAIAEHLAGFPAAFVARMNTKARDLELSETHFENPHGLSAKDQYTTAHDVTRLALHLIQNYPSAVELHSMKTFQYNGINQRNRNRLLWKDPRVDGLKTGWLDEAGYHIVATAIEGERRLIAVVMGARSERAREEIALRLLNYGFKNFRHVVFFSKGDRVKNLPVWKGTEDHVGIFATGPGIVAVKNGTPEPTLAYHLPEKLIAPIPAGQKLGEAVFTVEGRDLVRVDLVVVDPVTEAGFMKRLFHSFLLLFY